MYHTTMPHNKGVLDSFSLTIPLDHAEVHLVEPKKGKVKGLYRYLSECTVNPDGPVWFKVVVETRGTMPEFIRLRFNDDLRAFLAARPGKGEYEWSTLEVRVKMVRC